VCRNIAESNEDSENHVVIDTGELVWSVALAMASGKHRVSTTLGRPHYRYKVSGGIVIATGLASGRIRIWDVRTGSVWLLCC
jgi:WD40 repeat protein